MPLPRFAQRLSAAYGAAGVEGTRLLLAVSGGADSSALLVATARLAPQLRLHVEVATVAHGLRAAAREEAEAVAAACAKFGLRHSVLAAEVMPGTGVEARARDARYAVLERERCARGLDFVVTAHTADDQAETVLMRLLRGAGLRGLRGVHARRGTLLRPMLGCRRSSVAAFLRDEGVTPAQDAMNLDPAYLRVRVRQSVLPTLAAAAGFDATDNLAAFARSAAEDESFLDAEARRAFDRVRFRPDSADAPGTPGLDAVALRALPAAIGRRVLRQFLEEHGVSVSLSTLERAARSLGEGTSEDVGGGFLLRTAGNRVRCVKTSRDPLPSMDPPVTPGLEPSRTDEGGLRFPLLNGDAIHIDPPGAPSESDGETAKAAGTHAWSGWVRWADDASMLVRSRRPGDRLAESGRRLQDFFVDAKVPEEARDGFMLVVHPDGGVEAVVGLWSRGGASKNSSPAQTFRRVRLVRP